MGQQRQQQQQRKKKGRGKEGSSSSGDDGDGEWTVVTSSRRHAVPPKPQPASSTSSSSSGGSNTDERAPNCARFESSVVSIAVPTKPSPEEKKKKQEDAKKQDAKKKKAVEPRPEPPVSVPVPKGMSNPSATLCFMNSVLQALLACEPLRALVRRLGAPAAGTAQPVTRALASLVAQTREGSVAAQDAAVRCSSVYSLVLFEDGVLPAFCRATGNFAGTQQDAQEWYSFLVTALQEEHAVPATTRPDADAASEWTMVDGRKRSVVLNAVTDFASGPVADVFFGCLESAVRRRGSPAPSVSVQPFECVHLDISHAGVATVASALALFQAPEAVAPGVSRSTAFAALPQILCLHLKRFIFTMSGSEKVTKPVAFESTLELRAKKGGTRHYRLVAVVRHFGDTTRSGHYITDVLCPTHTHSGPGTAWLRCNDARLEWVPRTTVFADTQTPYLLFYVRTTAPHPRA